MLGEFYSSLPVWQCWNSSSSSITGSTRRAHSTHTYLSQHVKCAGALRHRNSTLSSSSRARPLLGFSQDPQGREGLTPQLIQGSGRPQVPLHSNQQVLGATHHILGTHKALHHPSGPLRVPRHQGRSMQE